jgi:hypothetical protein
MAKILTLFLPSIRRSWAHVARGKVQVPSFVLYSDKEWNHHRISFPTSEEDLKVLAETCEPATFGLLQEDKLDLDYRSAWKMDHTQFACSFHPSDASDILNTVQDILLPLGSMYAELYKLNVGVFHFGNTND